MSLFNSNFKTYIVKASEEAEKVYMVCAMSAKRSFEDFWYTMQAGQKVLKSKAVLEQQVAELDTYAVEVMAQHSSLQSFLYNLRPYNPVTKMGWIPLYPPYSYVENPDGTITLGELVSAPTN